MGKTKVSISSEPKIKLKPALTPEADENQMISLAVDLAKKQLMEGTASSQVITHFLKLGTEREKLEREKLKRENELLQAKAKAVEDSQSQKELYAEALAAFRVYSGQSRSDDECEDDEY